MNGMWWFMSYAYKRKGCDELNIGSVAYDDEETPWEKITRWNKEYHGREMALLSFQKMPGKCPDLDVEI